MIQALKEELTSLSYTKIGRDYSQYIPEFLSWVERNWSIIFERYAKSNNPVARYNPQSYVAALVKSSSKRVAVNLFAAWLVAKGIASAYYLIRNKYVAGAESIYTWLRTIRSIET